jgi:hypothetical protein
MHRAIRQADGMNLHQIGAQAQGDLAAVGETQRSSRVVRHHAHGLGQINAVSLV